jgi:hypothetical protein
VTHTRHYLLDTNVLSETRRKHPDTNVVSFLASTPSANLFVSALTIGELRRGVERKRATDARAASALDAWLTGLQSGYSDRVLPVSSDVADRWGRLASDRRRPAIDTLLAATALVHDLVLVTRNGKDVEGTGAETLNPWT